MIEVSAGIIRRADGRILVCRRGEGRKNAHLWEFPGGKREAGEDAAACLARELEEELALSVRDIRPVAENEAQGIRFTFLLCQTDGHPVPTEHEEIRFVQPREMLGLPFCPADTEIARRIALSAPPLRHFFWDFDGTLVDSYPGLTAMLVRACASLGIAEDPAHALALMKNSLGYAIGCIAQQHGLAREALEAAVQAQHEDEQAAHYPLLPGVKQTLEALSSLGGRHYLVTHRGRAALDCLAFNGLDGLFSGAVTREMGFPRKPAPDSILYLMAAHGVEAQTAVMIGDRPLDTQAGSAAGILSCLLDTEGRFPEEACDLRASCAGQLAGLLCPEKLWTEGE